MPQRMRYSWLVDRPRNVPRRDYDHYQLRLFGAIGLGMIAVGLLVSSIGGLTLMTTRELAAVEGMTVEEALAYEGDARDLVKIEGFLLAEDPTPMPDDEAQLAIRGQLRVIARPAGRDADAASEASGEATEAEADAGTEAGTVPPPTTLLAWEATAASVFLSDGDRQIPLAFDPIVLPLAEDAGDVEPEYIREGDSARTSRPVAVQYGEALLPLPEAYRDQRSGVIVEVERAVLPQGASAVVLAGLAVTPEGNQLVDPLGDRLRISLGTEAAIREQGQSLRVMFFLLAIPMGIASTFLGRSAMAMRREFVKISNE